MLRRLPLIALALGLLTGVRAGPPAGADGKTILFDGRTLDDWVAEGKTETVDRQSKKPAPVWTVRDGNIHCAGDGFGFLRYGGREFDDFQLHVEYRMLGEGGRNNSGIGIRTVPFDPKRSKDTRPSYACYEIQLLNDAGAAPSAHGTGSLYRYVAPQANVVRPAPEWNTMDIICTGPRIRVRMNGAEILDVDQTTMDRIKGNPLKGYVCLQNHGTPIEFRNLWVKELNPAK